MDDKETTSDWVNLPEGADTLSLWDTLHDGDLLQIESDLTFGELRFAPTLHF